MGGGKSVNKSKNISFRKSVEIPSTTYATFALYKYPAKFIPHVVAYTLEKYGKPGMSVFDPFAGYGTVGVVSKLLGYDYELWDLNPLLEVFHPIAIMDEPQKIDIHTTFRQMKSSKDEFIPDWSNLDYWYPAEFLPFLYKIWGYYHALDNNELKKILTIPLLKITRRALGKYNIFVWNV